MPVQLWVANANSCGGSTYRIILLGEMRGQEERYFGILPLSAFVVGKRAKK